MPETAVTTKRNILWLILDDWRNEAAGAYFQRPHVLTPSLDAFAKSALTFGRAYSQEALCGPSRASFLSGRSPSSSPGSFATDHGGGRAWKGRPGQPSLPEYFKWRLLLRNGPNFD